MLPSAVLTHLKAGVSTALRPEPVRIGWWVQPAVVTPRKHDRPSLTTVQPASRLRLAKAAISLRRKPRTRRSLRRTGRPSAVVSTVATIGVLPAAPRPRLPPERWPPRSADQALLGVPLHHHLLEFVLDR